MPGPDDDVIRLACENGPRGRRLRVPRSGNDPDLDPRFVDELLHDFPNLDVLEQIKAFRWYYDDEPFTDVKKPRVSLRRWLANARTRDRR